MIVFYLIESFEGKPLVDLRTIQKTIIVLGGSIDVRITLRDVDL
jgi:hypothetical protein